MTPTRRIIRARMSDLARTLPPAHRTLEVGIAGDDPPGANREFFPPGDGVYETMDYNADLKPTYTHDITEDVPTELRYRFDRVICSQVLEHIWKLEAAAFSLWQLTAINGHLIVDTPFFYLPHGDDKEPDYWRLTPQALERLLKRAGFVHLDMWHDPAYMLVGAVAWRSAR